MQKVTTWWGVFGFVVVQSVICYAGNRCVQDEQNIQQARRFVQNNEIRRVRQYFGVTDDEKGGNDYLFVFLWNRASLSYFCGATYSVSNITFTCKVVDRNHSTIKMKAERKVSYVSTAYKYFQTVTNCPPYGLPESCGYPYKLTIEAQYGNTYYAFNYDSPNVAQRERKIDKLTFFAYDFFKEAGFETNYLSHIHNILFGGID